MVCIKGGGGGSSKSTLQNAIKKALEAGKDGSQDAIASDMAQAIIDAIKAADVEINLSTQTPPVIANDKSPLSGKIKGKIT